MNIEEQVIEKHIIQHLYAYGDYEFDFMPCFKLQQSVSYLIKNELDVSIVGVTDFEKVYNELIEREIIEVIYKEKDNHNSGGKIILGYSSSVLEYALSQGYIDTKTLMHKIDNKFGDTIKIFLAQLEKNKRIDTEIESQRRELLGKIEEHDKQIEQFNKNTLTIMGLLIAAFSIIGFNIGGIKFILGTNEKIEPWVYAGSIAIINFSMVFSLYFLLFLINKIVNKNDKPIKFNIFSSKLNFILISAIVIIIICSFIIA